MADEERREDTNQLEQHPVQYHHSSPHPRGLSPKLVRKTAALVFSHIGLAAIVVAYTVMGGFLFKFLEAPNESKEKLRIIEFKDEKAVELLSWAENLCVNQMDRKTFNASVMDMFLTFQKRVTVAVKNNGWDGLDETDESALQWSFAGSLLYAVTVITTIGYGHVAPKTTHGRMITIVYALVGIPLTFLYLSNMGNAMAKCFRLFYKKVCCGLCIYRSHWTEQLNCCRKKSIDSDDDDDDRSKSLSARRASRPVRVILAAQYNRAYDTSDTADQQYQLTPTSDQLDDDNCDTGNGGPEAFRMSPLTANTGLNHVTKSSRDGGVVQRSDNSSSPIRPVPDETSDVTPEVTCTSSTVRVRRRFVWRRRLSLESAVESSNCWRCRQPVVLSVDRGTDAPVSLVPDTARRRRTAAKKTTKRSKKPTTTRPGNGEMRGELVLDLDKLGLLGGHNADSHLEDVKVTVPISICLIVIAGYLSAGSLMFMMWEEWDYFGACYFCFVTLSTIGFGDLVPGTGLDESSAHGKLLLCAIYLAFGLSMLAMCFNLMQEEVKEKFQWIGRKLGLLKDFEKDDGDDDDDDDDDDDYCDVAPSSD